LVEAGKPFDVEVLMLAFRATLENFGLQEAHDPAENLWT
jgi:hypothetical protein